MPVQSHLPLSHSNQYTADSACGHCEGVIRHEAWCITQNASIQYAYQALLDPGHLSPGDQLILHALGAAWTPKSVL
jgi:3-oxoacyl-[acyl-carrier-protein] synthase III